jgi:DNA polymerase (family 10)
LVGASLSQTLSQLALLARIRGSAPDELALRNAETIVRDLHIRSDADLGPVIDSPPADADRSALRLLRHMYEAGAWVLVESAIADLPADLRWLYESGAVTIEQLASLHDQLGVTSLADLAAKVAERAIRPVDGLGERIERAVESALGDLRRSIPRIPLGRADALLDPILAHLRSLPTVAWALPVGSVRRALETAGDIEVVAAAADPTPAVEALVDWSDVDRVLHRGPRRLYLLMDRTQIGFRFPEPANAGATLLHLTGSAAHFRALQSRAVARGWQLTSEGLRTPEGTPRPAATEEDIYAALGLPLIPPEIREGGEEIVAAERGALPSLLTLENIRGDLHMHSRWSDGHESIAAMVEACRALKYEYVAITDHSPHSGAPRSLTVQAVARQADEIAALRERLPDITILHGCEVDILPDGRLDFADRVLERFDIVLASLHHRAGHGPEQLLRRYLSAMRHPLVALITHPTNRLVPHRPAYDLDYDRLFEAAVDTGTTVEIDGAPVHLDLDGALARRAVAAGATVAVNSDCHRADQLARQMRLGVLTARRGWVEARHVLNTRPLTDIRAVIARKRRS